MSDDRKGMRVVFLHPDLGLGGAEKLIVEAAVALQEKGHDVTICTSYYNPDRCFPQTKGFDVRVAGDFLPRSFFGKFHIFFAILRAVYLSIYTSLMVSTDVYITDQIAVYNIILRALSSKPIVFYCHFPDQLLTSRKSVLKSLYRLPFDTIEELGTAFADSVMVNSKFTETVFRKTFRWLSHMPLRVVYPAISVPSVGSFKKYKNAEEIVTFLSINRYERKKNIALALKAFAILHRNLTRAKTPSIRLIIAGGWDSRVKENVEYHQELVELARDTYKLSEDSVQFIRSFDDSEKTRLIASASAVLYTPEGEHFGIVPIEAMAHQTPVVAVNSGGPKETIEDGKSGYLCEKSPEAWAEKMMLFVKDKQKSTIMGLAGRERVEDKFSYKAFQNTFDGTIRATRTNPLTELWLKALVALFVSLLVLKVVVPQLRY